MQASGYSSRRIAFMLGKKKIVGCYTLKRDWLSVSKLCVPM
jgi:hypothetical protein